MESTATATSTSSTAAPLDDATRGKWLVVALASLGHRITQALIEELGPDTTSNMPLLVLSELSLRGPLRPRDLLETTHLTSGGLTKVLDQLEAQGLIERVFGTLAEDRRASVASLTPKGAEVIDRVGEIVSAALEAERPLLRRLGELIQP